MELTLRLISSNGFLVYQQGWYSAFDGFVLANLVAASDSSWIIYPPNGFATMTHYGLPLGDIAACGCAPDSTYYPTAALNQMAYGIVYLSSLIRVHD